MILFKISVSSMEQFQDYRLGRVLEKHWIFSFQWYYLGSEGGKVS